MQRTLAPELSLILRDTAEIGPRETLRITPSNRGEPFRQTLVLSFEKGAEGDWRHYEHIASIELEPDEEKRLRDLLNARNPPRTP